MPNLWDPPLGISPLHPQPLPPIYCTSPSSSSILFKTNLRLTAFFLLIFLFVCTSAVIIAGHNFHVCTTSMVTVFLCIKNKLCHLCLHCTLICCSNAFFKGAKVYPQSSFCWMFPSEKMDSLLRSSLLYDSKNLSCADVVQNQTSTLCTWFFS